MRESTFPVSKSIDMILSLLRFAMRMKWIQLNHGRKIKVNCFLNVALIKNAPDLSQGWALNFCGVPSSRYAFISHVKPL